MSNHFSASATINFIDLDTVTGGGAISLRQLAIDTGGNALAGAAGGAVAGGITGSFAGGVGALPGAGIGAAVGFAGGAAKGAVQSLWNQYWR